MSEQTPSVMQKLLMRESQIRLWSGLVLFAYVLSHFLNHALGLFSLQAMEAGREIFLALWRNYAGTILLYGALATHLVLVLTRLWRRRSLRMPWNEASQIILGLMIPMILAYHVVGTRLAHQLYGVNDLYSYVLVSLMIFDPKQGILQIFALFMVWGHGCFGLYFWLRLKPWYDRFRVWLAAAAIALPMLALGGYISGAREASLLYVQDPVWAEAMRGDVSFAGYAQISHLRQIIDWIEMAVPVLVAVLFVLRVIRSLVMNRMGSFWQISWPDGRKHPLRNGQTVLDVARNFNIPHASVCGGRGRCSTCRIRIVEGCENLPPANEQEQKVLARLVPQGDQLPMSLRLACQCKPNGPVSVMPLLPPTTGAAKARQDQQWSAGQEKVITILFADLRGFTSMSENRLPYDTVFMLNQYFHQMGVAIEKEGGYLDKFIGDGIMALFGLETDAKTGANQGLAAAQAMIANMEKLNENLKGDLTAPLRIGIGLHTGPAIVGDMGYGNGRALTAIGDTVNTASRIESATKEHQTQALIAESVWDAAEKTPPNADPVELMLRGKTTALHAWKLD